MKIIVYGSQYGSAKEYGEELSRRTGIKAEEYKKVRDIAQYDTIAYIGALYAGSVLGMKKTLNKIRDCSEKKIVIATVGLADPDDKDNTDRITDNIKKQLSDDVYNHASIHFLRGRIDYSTLSIKHKTMMAFVHRKAENLKEGEKTAEVKAILETYGKKVSYMDFDSLNPIIDELK